jgi:hypothetical protein
VVAAAGRLSAKCRARLGAARSGGRRLLIADAHVGERRLSIRNPSIATRGRAMLRGRPSGCQRRHMRAGSGGDAWSVDVASAGGGDFRTLKCDGERF